MFRETVVCSAQDTLERLGDGDKRPVKLFTRLQTGTRALLLRLEPLAMFCEASHSLLLICQSCSLVVVAAACIVLATAVILFVQSVVQV